MTQTWHVQAGNVQVVEDADSASLVIVGKELFSTEDKIAALKEVLERMMSAVEQEVSG
jgi:flagellar basal body rod protein FlgG